MLKKSALRRIMVSTIALIIVGILYFFPSSSEITNVPITTNYLDVIKNPIYLINKDNYVIRTDIIVNSDTPLDKAKELIEALTIDSSKSEYIIKNFKPIIPKNTKIIDISLEDGLLKVNFSKEFLNVTKDEEEKLIEALVYTLTEIKEIKEIMIFIEKEKLEILPQSQVRLPNTLNRNIGINKVYDLDNLKNASKTTIYFLNKEDDLLYYVPVTKVHNDDSNKIEIIIEELKSSPIYQTNLISYLASSTELLNYETLENQISLSFNQAIFEDLNERNIKEEVKYSISLSLKDTYNAEEVIFKVDDEVITTWKAFD